MRKSFLLVLMAAAAFLGGACSLEENLEKPKGNPDDLHVKPVLPDLPDEGETEIDPAVFTLLNLDYPGLEQVKAAYGEGNILLAAACLLDYYRNRTDVINPDVSFNPNCYPADYNKAKQATEAEGWRFCVKKYPEKKGETEAEDKYYSFANKGEIDWDVVPAAVGDDKEWKQKYRMQWMAAQAKVYCVTKDEEYARSWIKALSSFMEKYTYKNEDGSFKFFGNGANDGPWEGLQTAERLLEILPSFEYYKFSENVTPEFLCTLLVYIYDHVASVRTNPWHDPKSNIVMKQLSAVLGSGMYFPEFKDAELWLESAGTTLTEQLTSQFNADGVHSEFDLHYHIAAVADFVNIYKAAKINGKLGLFPSNYTSYLKNAAYFTQDMIYPSDSPEAAGYKPSYPYYTVEGFNETRRSDKNGNSLLKPLREYNLMFPDEGDFLYMSTARKYGTAPSADLKAYPVSGYYIFRSGWEAKDMVLIHKNINDPRAYDFEQHNQPDNGTISLYRNNRAFMPDAGVSAYKGSDELNQLRMDYCATAAHSTMNKNMENVQQRSGRCLKYESDGNIEYVVTENPGYADLTHRRAIFFVDKSFFVIVDEGYSDVAVEKVQLAFALSDWMDMAFMITPDNSSPFTVATNYTDGNNMLYKTFTSEGVSNYTAEFSSEEYYLNDVTTLDRYEIDKRRRAMYRITVDKPADKAARFITVIHPISKKADIDALNIQAYFTDSQSGQFNPGETAVKVMVGNSEYDLSYTLN